MAKYVIQSKHGAPPQGAYSQGWRAGDFIFVSGTGPVDPATGELVGNTIEQQTEQTIDNMLSILQADGATLADVVKVTAHLSDTALFARYNTVYACMTPSIARPRRCAPPSAVIWGTPPECWSNSIASRTRRRKRKRSNRARQSGNPQRADASRENCELCAFPSGKSTLIPSL